ncbi:glycosyltransferase [Desulfocicer vacuolatum]|uniref:glycosyltransferase n=1 Tax=Desulfocicer vacuolatum TaxID=2298 RepID=UPI0014830E5D|nr:glycosyltransferase [Desulfocicer vacuolatum]
MIDVIAKNNVNCRAIHLPPNSGQSAALEAGFSKARGTLIVTLDGDGQKKEP